MNWTDMNEIEMIKMWALENFSPNLKKCYLPQPDASKNSYWTVCDDGNDIDMYDFSSIPELRQIFENKFNEEIFKELIIPLTVAAFKGKAKAAYKNQIEEAVANKESDKNNANEFEIPEFVYVF